MDEYRSSKADKKAKHRTVDLDHSLQVDPGNEDQQRDEDGHEDVEVFMPCRDALDLVFNQLVKASST